MSDTPATQIANATVEVGDDPLPEVLQAIIAFGMTVHSITLRPDGSIWVDTFGPIAARRGFHNRLRVMLNLDGPDLAGAGVIESMDQWEAYSRDPFRWFLRADDKTAEKLWALIETRHLAAGGGR